MVYRSLVVAVLVAACGGDDAGEPLIAGSLTASYAGTAFTPVNGYATLYNDSFLVVLGDGGIRCGSEKGGGEPPPGRTAVFEIGSFDVGVYSAFTQMFTNVGNFEGVGSSTGGTVTISASSETSVAGEVSFAYTDDENRMFSVAGTFEAMRCP